MSAHGTKERSLTCGCLACVRLKPTPRLRWPIKPLADAVGREVLSKSMGRNAWTSASANGVADLDMDELCVKWGLHPADILDGYFEAALDFYSEE